MLAASLNAFLGLLRFTAPPMVLRFQQDFTFSKGVTVCCEAANWRNEKKALSAATSFFPFRLLLRNLLRGEKPLNSWIQRVEIASGLVLFRGQGGEIRNTPPYLWPARSASHLTEKENLPHAAGAPARSASLYRFATAISARFSSRIRSSTVFTAVSTSAFGMRAMSTAHA